MTDTSSPAAGAEAPVPTDQQAVLDSYGHDPSDYRWVPVLRKPRADGWSNVRQVAFIEALADTGSVTMAARAVEMSVTSCYRLRRAPGAENFARAWDAAIQQASLRLTDVAFERALNGVEQPVFENGTRIGCRTYYNDRLLMFLLRAHQPERYRAAHRAERDADEVLPRDPAPLRQAIAALDPVVPPDPHTRMSPDELDTALEVAEITEGKLPHYYRESLPGLDETVPEPPAVSYRELPAPKEPSAESFESRLMAALADVDAMIAATERPARGEPPRKPRRSPF